MPPRAGATGDPQRHSWPTLPSLLPVSSGFCHSLELDVSTTVFSSPFPAQNPSIPPFTCRVFPPFSPDKESYPLTRRNLALPHHSSQARPSLFPETLLLPSSSSTLLKIFKCGLECTLYSIIAELFLPIILDLVSPIYARYLARSVADDPLPRVPADRLFFFFPPALLVAVLT